MSDPYRDGTPDKPENLDKKPADSEDGEPSRLQLDALNKDAAAANAATTRKDAAGAESGAERAVPNVDLSFAANRMVSGLSSDRINMPLRKSEFTATGIEKPIQQYKPQITEFLKNTAGEHHELKNKMSEAELRQLERAREALSNATNTQDALSDALHLARLYQHMRYIEEAKKALDLSLGIDPDNYHGNQLFRELERMHPADLGGGSATEAPASVPLLSDGPLTKSNLRKRILSLTGGKVIVLGDLLIDELLEGKPERISREAPVLILEHVDTELIPGGAANTANNIAALGGMCHAIGVCGNDEYAGKLEALFDKAQITHALVRDDSRPTTVKTRILSKSHSFKQQLLRLDRICHDKIAPRVEAQLMERLHDCAGRYQALVLSDYRAGVMTDSLIRSCRVLAAQQKLLVIVDAQDDFTRFRDVNLITPNQPDAEKAVGFAIDSKESLQKAGDQLLSMTGASALLITRGGEGMVLFQQNTPMIELPAFNKSEVFDVTGAGDTVVATMALALVTGSSYLEAMALGNLAAGIVVKKPGTAVTSQKEMLENLDLLKIDE